MKMNAAWKNNSGTIATCMATPFPPPQRWTCTMQCWPCLAKNDAGTLGLQLPGHLVGERITEKRRISPLVKAPSNSAHLRRKIVRQPRWRRRRRRRRVTKRTTTTFSNDPFYFLPFSSYFHPSLPPLLCCSPFCFCPKLGRKDGTQRRRRRRHAHGRTRQVREIIKYVFRNIAVTPTAREGDAEHSPCRQGRGKF